MPPVKPMLAKSVPEVPEQPGMLYEPKWDGFRSIVFRDGDEVEIGSRNERPLTRYFPEVVAAVQAGLPERCVVDGEVVIVAGPGLDFEALLQRIHPAASRVTMLAQETPARLLVFDLLALDDEDWMHRPLVERRQALEELFGSGSAGGAGVHLTPSTADPAVAREWFSTFEGAGLDGVVAKPGGLPYAPDKRTMFKIKHARTADCVVAGFRWHKSGEPAVGSLMLGLYDDSGVLHHVGVAASFPMARRRSLADELAPYRTDLAGHPWSWGEHAAPASAAPSAAAPSTAASSTAAPSTAAAPDEPSAAGGRTPREAESSRWNRGKDLSFHALRPELVVEVAYDHLEGPRFRHTAQFVRWRPDREPASCTYAQLDRPVAYDLSGVLG